MRDPREYKLKVAGSLAATPPSKLDIEAAAFLAVVFHLRVLEASSSFDFININILPHVLLAPLSFNLDRSPSCTFSLTNSNLVRHSTLKPDNNPPQ